MKVLFFIGSIVSGGAERVTVRLANYLAAKGYQVTLVTLRDCNDDFYIANDGVKRIGLDLAGHNRGFKKVIAGWSRVCSLRRIIRSEEPDVVVGMIYTATILCILAGFGLPVRVVGSERNYPGMQRIGWCWALLRYFLYRFADAHVAQSREGADWIINHYSARNVTVIPNAVVWPIPACLPKIDPLSFVGPERNLILAVGSKPHQKGFDLLLRAYARIAYLYPDWDLAIVGISPTDNHKSNILSQLQAQMVSKGISDRVFFPGRVGNIADWYERADLFVLSSRYEGFPNVLLEAMAAGCACVAFDCDTGPRDVIVDGVNGILVSAENVDDLYQALLKMISSRTLIEQYGKRSKRVRTDYNEDKIFTQWINLIGGAL